MQELKVDNIKNFDCINIIYKSNSKESLESFIFKDNKIKIYTKNKKLYLNIQSKSFEIFLNENANSIEILDFSNIRLDDKDIYCVWIAKSIEKTYTGFKFDKIPFLDKKYIKVETDKKGLYINVEIQKLNNLYYVVKDGTEVLGKINDVRLSAFIEGLDNRKNILVLKDDILEIYFLSEILRGDFSRDFNIIIKAKDEKSFNRIRTNIEFGSRISDKVWMFLSLNSSENNEETNSEFIIHILDKSYFCTVCNKGLIIKEPCRRYNRGKVYAIVKPANIINYINYNKIDEINECISKDLNHLLELNKKDESEFIKLINTYKNFELDVLEEKKKELNELKYKSIQNNTFYIYDDSIKYLEKWNRNLGIYVAIKLKKDTDIIGSLKSVDENSITVEFDSDLTRSILPQKGTLIIDSRPSEIMQNRRKKALEKLNKGTSALVDLKDMLSGEYIYSPCIMKKDFKKSNVKDMNKNQLKAIEAALNTNDLFLIQGPPGTGKTTVIRNIVENAIRNNDEVLISSFQNLAVDNVLDGFLESDIFPFRFYSKFDDSDSMKFICNEIVGEISKSISENISRKEENNLITYKEKLNSIKGAFLKERDNKKKIELLKEILEIIKKFNGKNSTFNVLSKIISDSKKENFEYKDDCFKDEILDMIPKEYEQDEEIYDRLKDSYDYARKVNKTFKEIKSVVEELERLIDINVFFDLDKDKFKESLSFINDELNRATNYCENKELILDEDFIINVLNDEIESLPEFIEDEKYEIIDKFVNKIKNTPTIIENILKKYADVKGTTCQKVGSKAFNDSIGNIDYSYVIVDEAARANPLDLIIPIVKGKRIILVGDHKQLPHMIENYIESKFEEEKEINKEMYEEYIKESLFGRLYKILPNDRKIMLNTQYRMTKEIGDLVSDLFYEGKLKTGTNIVNDTPFYTGKALVGKNILSKQNKNNLGSYINVVEANEIIKNLIELDRKNENKKKISVGVISFYKAQVNFIKTEIRRKQIEFKNIDLSIGTVDSYQGLEKEIIFLSTVRSEGIGFTSNHNRLNVALSRAKKLVVIFSNRKNMSKDETFRKIFERCYWEDDVCI